MKKIKIIICTEAPYAEKLASYIRENEGTKLTAAWYAEKDSGNEQIHEADILVLGEEYLPEAEAMSAAAGNALPVLLAEDAVEKKYDSYPVISKYQPAAEIIRKLYAYAAEYLPDETIGWGTAKEHIAIYAPWNYELSMVFGITLAQMLSMDGRLLYISMQESMGMTQLMGIEEAAGMEDLIAHLRIGRSNAGAKLKSLCHPIGKAEFASPVRNPQNIIEITGEDYERLFALMEEQQEYERILWEFGPMHAGALEWMNHCQEIYSPYQNEVLHQKRKQQLEDIFQLHQQPELIEKVQFIKLPHIHLSVGENPEVSRLLYGDFGDRIREQVMAYRA